MVITTFWRVDFLYSAKEFVANESKYVDHLRIYLNIARRITYSWLPRDVFRINVKQI